MQKITLLAVAVLPLLLLMMMLITLLALFASEKVDTLTKALSDEKKPRVCYTQNLTSLQTGFRPTAQFATKPQYRLIDRMLLA